LITGGLFSQGAYAPSAQMARQIGYYEQYLSVRSNYILKNYQTMIKASGYNTDDKTDQFAVYLAQTITNTAPGQYYSYAPAPAGYYPGNAAPKIQTVFPWQMAMYMDTALALASTAIAPKANGLNMCGGNNIVTNQFAVTNGTQFPWSQTLLTASGGSALKSITNGPCTGTPATGFTGSLPSTFKLTGTSFVGPSPLAASYPFFEDTKGNTIYSFNGTLDWLMSPNAAWSMVTLDQIANAGSGGLTCQQTPCNSLAPLGNITGVFLGYNGR